MLVSEQLVAWLGIAASRNTKRAQGARPTTESDSAETKKGRAMRAVNGNRVGGRVGSCTSSQSCHLSVADGTAPTGRERRVVISRARPPGFLSRAESKARASCWFLAWRWTAGTMCCPAATIRAGIRVIPGAKIFHLQPESRSGPCVHEWCLWRQCRDSQRLRRVIRRRPSEGPGALRRGNVG